MRRYAGVVRSDSRERVGELITLQKGEAEGEGGEDGKGEGRERGKAGDR